jgi:hypothetical protein
VYRWPLNQLAKKWLLQGNLHADSSLPYLVQLLWEGFNLLQDHATL